MTFHQTITALKKRGQKVSNIKYETYGFSFTLNGIKARYYNQWEETGRDYTEFLILNNEYELLVNNVMERYR